MVEMGSIESGERYEITILNGEKKFRLVDGVLRVAFSAFANRDEAKRFLLALSDFVDDWR